MVLSSSCGAVVVIDALELVVLLLIFSLVVVVSVMKAFGPEVLSSSGAFVLVETTMLVVELEAILAGVEKDVDKLSVGGLLVGLIVAGLATVELDVVVDAVCRAS